MQRKKSVKTYIDNEKTAEDFENNAESAGCEELRRTAEANV
jgi:hypothetical protein